MAETQPIEDMQLQGAPGTHEGPGYEHSDVNALGILLSGIGLAAVIILVMLALGWWIVRMSREEQRALEATPPRMADETGQYAGPALQASPAFDMTRLRQREETLLSSYGWADREAGVARIPIDRAMELVLPKLQSGGGPQSGDRPATSRDEPGATDEATPPVTTDDSRPRDRDTELPADPFQNPVESASPN